MGFQDTKLTLQISAKCFERLCKDCGKVLATYGSQFVDLILVPEFVSTWVYLPKYESILNGFAHLIEITCKENLDQCK